VKFALLARLFISLCLACSQVTRASAVFAENSFNGQAGLNDNLFDWNLTKANLTKANWESSKGFFLSAVQRSDITIDSTAPNFSGDAVIDGEITECSSPSLTLQELYWLWAVEAFVLLCFDKNVF
jgi:hypothetical protein